VEHAELVTIYRIQTAVFAPIPISLRLFRDLTEGVVHHASYLGWFEEGSALRALGYRMRRGSRRHRAAVTELAPDLHPARHDEEVIVACLQETAGAGIRQGAPGRGPLLATGITRLVSWITPARLADCRRLRSRRLSPPGDRDHLRRGFGPVRLRIPLFHRVAG
jgi:hypothetical protein